MTTIPSCLVRDWNPTQLYWGLFHKAWNMDPVMKQPGFNGKYPIGRFFFVAHLYPIPSMGLVDLSYIYHKNQPSRWWFQIFFNVHPYLVKISNLTNIFQMGWNHQLVFGIFTIHLPLKILKSTIHVGKKYQSDGSYGGKRCPMSPWANGTKLHLSGAWVIHPPS